MRRIPVPAYLTGAPVHLSLVLPFARMEKNAFRRFAAWLVFFCAVIPLCALADIGYPEPRDPNLNDFARILSAGDAAAMQHSLAETQRQTGIQITLVTLRSLADHGAGGMPLSQYASRLFDRWGIGDKARNDGILICKAEAAAAEALAADVREAAGRRQMVAMVAIAGKAAFVPPPRIGE
jgi:hypothetical protein